MVPKLFCECKTEKNSRAYQTQPEKHFNNMNLIATKRMLVDFRHHSAMKTQ